ncbi:Uncharacterised protein [Mycobacterium tuberculosis]|uniref:Uncharacterized protein n=1 Tax=Mycobacterium tuberculosis TaxID=1773 RepID=A0A916P9Y6_MYCTX|nr:Uncharacterised protein [Mycobacterium tuberculosis]CPA79576.1 Uncharacterised protein [Mycobacterium tuberculosis]CPB01539.1 Uncharacterised protein [Mycobacterium tuberculosis]
MIPTPPSAPKAATNPMTTPEMMRDQSRRSASLRSRERLHASKIVGIILYTDPLPNPDRTNNATKQTK